MTGREVYDALALHWDEQEFSEVRPGIRGATRDTAQLTVTVYVYEPGCRWEEHRHPEDQVTVICEGGEIEFTVAGELLRLGPGDLAILPGDVPHSAHVRPSGERVVSVNTWRRRSAPR